MIYQNGIISQSLMTFFKKSLEKASSHQYQNNKLESSTMCEQIIYACEEIICETIKSKLSNFLSSYENRNWAPQSLEQERFGALEDALNYLNVSLLFLRVLLIINNRQLSLQ